jgi:hypothetical protein
MEASREYVARSHLVMRRHDEMGEQALRRLLADENCEFRHDAVWAKVDQQVKLRRARNFRPLVSQVDDLALC